MEYKYIYGIMLSRQPGNLFLKILKKEHTFLNQRLFSRDPKLNCWYSFSFEVPGIAVVTAR